MLPVMLLRAVRLRCMPGAAAGGAVRAGRGWRATGSGRLEKLRIKEAMTRGALPHGGGGRRFFLPGSRRFERPSAACARRGSRVAAPAPTAVGASPRPPLAAWVRVCPGSAARKRFERPSWRGGKRRNPAEKAAAGGLQTVEKPLVLERAAFLASFGRSQRSRKMLRHKALGLCPKPRQGDDPPAPRTLSAA